MNSEREKILGRIREALRVTAHVPGGHGEGADEVSEQKAIQTAPRWLPAVGETFDERTALFQKNAIELRAEFHLLGSEPELFIKLREIARTEGWKSVGSHGGKLADFACEGLGLPVCRTDKPYDVNQLEQSDAGISECDALIAQTGSVLITSTSAGGRTLSVLPPHHVVLAKRDQLVPDLPAAFALLKEKYAPNYPSLISLITGPSRTGDIERILVLGAHGPKKLTILCL